jgi:hypothetical protein
MHARQQIRAAIATALTGLTSSEDRVYVGRTRPIPADKTTGFQPLSLRIYTPEESGEHFSVAANATEMRRLRIRIEGSIITDHAPDDELDQSALEVEQALAAIGDNWPIRFKRITVPSTTIAVETKGDKHDGAYRIEYLVSYSVKQAAPDVII